MSKQNKPQSVAKPTAETTEPTIVTPTPNQVETIKVEEPAIVDPDTTARLQMEETSANKDEEADLLAQALEDEAKVKADEETQAAELKAIAEETLAKAAKLAEADDVSVMVKTITHEIQKYLESYSKSNLPVTQRISQHSSLIRLFDNVVKLQNAEDFIGCMDVILRAYKANCGQTQAFHESVVNRYSSEVTSSMKATLAFQFFIYMLSVVATHHSKVIPTNFAKDISSEEFGKHFPGVAGERLLLWATRLCQ